MHKPKTEEAKKQLRDIANKAPAIGSIVMANSAECTDVIDLALQGVRDVLTKMLTETMEDRSAIPNGETSMYAFKIPFVLIMPKKD